MIHFKNNVLYEKCKKMRIFDKYISETFHCTFVKSLKEDYIVVQYDSAVSFLVEIPTRLTSLGGFANFQSVHRWY